MKWYRFWKKWAIRLEKLGIFVMFIAICIGVMADKVVGFVIGLIAILIILISMLCRWFSN